MYSKKIVDKSGRRRRRRTIDNFKPFAEFNPVFNEELRKRQVEDTFRQLVNAKEQLAGSNSNGGGGGGGGGGAGNKQARNLDALYTDLLSGDRLKKYNTDKYWGREFTNSGDLSQKSNDDLKKLAVQLEKESNFKERIKRFINNKTRPYNFENALNGGVHNSSFTPDEMKLIYNTPNTNEQLQKLLKGGSRNPRQDFLSNGTVMLNTDQMGNNNNRSSQNTGSTINNILNKAKLQNKRVDNDDDDDDDDENDDDDDDDDSDDDDANISTSLKPYLGSKNVKAEDQQQQQQQQEEDQNNSSLSFNLCLDVMNMNTFLKKMSSIVEEHHYGFSQTIYYKQLDSFLNWFLRYRSKNGIYNVSIADNPRYFSCFIINKSVTDERLTELCYNIANEDYETIKKDDNKLEGLQDSYFLPNIKKLVRLYNNEVNDQALKIFFRSIVNYSGATKKFYSKQVNPGGYLVSLAKELEMYRYNKSFNKTLTTSITDHDQQLLPPHYAYLINLSGKLCKAVELYADDLYSDYLFRFISENEYTTNTRLNYKTYLEQSFQTHGFKADLSFQKLFRMHKSENLSQNNNITVKQKLEVVDIFLKSMYICKTLPPAMFLNDRIATLILQNYKSVFETLKNTFLIRRDGGKITSILYRYVGVQILILHYYGCIDKMSGNEKSNVSGKLFKLLEEETKSKIELLLSLFDKDAAFNNDKLSTINLYSKVHLQSFNVAGGVEDDDDNSGVIVVDSKKNQSNYFKKYNLRGKNQS
jgi:hypothetical protein